MSVVQILEAMVCYTYSQSGSEIWSLITSFGQSRNDTGNRSQARSPPTQWGACMN